MSPLTALILAKLPFPEKVRIVEKLRTAAAAQQQGLRQVLRNRPSAQPSATEINNATPEHTMTVIPAPSAS
jgi:hypothetical protein